MDHEYRDIHEYHNRCYYCLCFRCANIKCKDFKCDNCDGGIYNTIEECEKYEKEEEE